MKYYIYQITNTINGKKYIGQHVIKKEYPRQYMGKGIGIKEAYKEYGKENFIKTILEEVEDDSPNRAKVSEREKYWIKKLNTMEPNGYNRHPGGIGGCTSESARKVVETKIKNGTNILSEETKKKISEANKGKKLTEEHKKNLSKNHHKKTIHTIIFEDGSIEKTSDSLVKIAERFNTSPQSLIRYSSKNKFINGMKLEGIEAENYVCCKNLPPKSQFIMCYDPVLKDECSLKNLKQRKSRKQDLYKNIIPENQIIKKEGENKMKFKQIINSLLTQDLYKFSMGQVIYHQFSDYKTTWTFKCRNKDVFFTPEMVEEITEQIKAYCDLRFTEDELEYLDKIKWLKGSYIDFLRLWRPRFEDFEITMDAECGLAIETKGTWLNTSMYEIPTLAIVNEVYFRMNYNYDELFESFKEKLGKKVKRIAINGDLCLSNFSEFGLRRRLSAEAQELVVKTLAETNYGCSTFVGTSNVYLAKKYGLTPVGTMAHEYIMSVGQGNHKHNPAYSNWYALDAWVKEYGVLNGIALTDTITTDCFLKDFQLTYATLFSGVRHDSGDPFVWGDKMIKHYRDLGIDPKTKTLLFSDSLDFEKADALFRYFNKDINVAFGIGTFLSNDTCVKPLNIVMKTTLVNGMDVAKISDTPGKGMCKNQEYVDYLQRCIDWRMEYEK